MPPSGLTRTRRTVPTQAARASSSSCSGTRRWSPSERRVSTTSTIAPPEPRSACCSTASSRSLPTPVRPVVVHTRDAEDDTAAALGGFTGTVILHCFSAPALLDVGPRARLLRLVCGERHVSEGGRSCANAPPGSRPTGFSRRPTARISRRCRCAGSGTSRPMCSIPSRYLRPLVETCLPSSKRASTTTPRSRSDCPFGDPRGAEEGAWPALSRRRQHPRRDRTAGGARSRRCRPRDRPGARCVDAHAVRALRLRAQRRDRHVAGAASR